MKKWTNLILLLTALTLILAACGGGTSTPTVQATPIPANAVIAEGHLVPNDDLTLSFTVHGKVAEVLVKKGEKVHEGDVLVRLADRARNEIRTGTFDAWSEDWLARFRAGRRQEERTRN